MLMKTRILFLLAFVACCCTTAMAQIQVKGTVVSDNDSEPMIGVAILESGTTNGCITDVDGNYTIQVKNSNATLIVSFVGYKTQNVKVNGRSVIDIRMEEDSKVLDEVVVVGYGVQRKSDLTGAVASVSSDDIKNLSTVDAGAALQGKASGVQILNTSGAPGSGAAIRIRGYSSNSGELGPLMIVDGLKVDNIQYLDPSLIQSIEVLKDAASAAIYGAQAGNGVILITTKTGNGSNGRPKITYSFKAINQNLGKTPEIFGAKDWIKYKELSSLREQWCGLQQSARDRLGEGSVRQQLGHPALRHLPGWQRQRPFLHFHKLRQQRWYRTWQEGHVHAPYRSD